jgi:hypothetical protein
MLYDRGFEKWYQSPSLERLRGKCENKGFPVRPSLLRKSEFLREAPENLLDMKAGKSNGNPPF